MNYAQANEKLTGRCKDSRKLQNNTYLQRRGQDIAVRLHATDVVTFHPNGDVTLRSGGWNTTTTKDRIRSYSPYSLWCERGQPFVTVNGTTHVFTDGITVKADGRTVEGTRETVESIRAEWREADRENSRISRWKSKARGLVRDKSACTKSHCWQCHPKPFRSARQSKPGPCDSCGCVLSRIQSPAPKLTVAKIEAEENATVRRAMILCYGLARILQESGAVIEQSPEFTFLRKEIDRWNAIAGMRDAEGNIIVVGGECRNLSDAREWYTKTAANALVNRGQGTTEDIVRAELLRSL